MERKYVTFIINLPNCCTRVCHCHDVSEYNVARAFVFNLYVILFTHFVRHCDYVISALYYIFVWALGTCFPFALVVCGQFVLSDFVYICIVLFPTLITVLLGVIDTNISTISFVMYIVFYYCIFSIFIFGFLLYLRSFRVLVSVTTRGKISKLDNYNHRHDVLPA